MKLLMIATALLVLSGCNEEVKTVPVEIEPKEQVTEPEEFTLERKVGLAVWLITDNVTGCQYVLHDSSGLIPRLNANGTQYCRKAVTP